MSDLILTKHRKKETKVAARSLSLEKKQLKFVKPVLFAAIYFVFILMSLQNDKLFLKEMLVSGGILSVLYVVHLLSQKHQS